MIVDSSERKEKRRELVLVVHEGPAKVARNTYRIRFEKPDGFTFAPGQSLKTNFKNEIRPDGNFRTPSFTIVSAPHEPFLEIVFRVKENEADWSGTKRSLMALTAGDEVPALDVLREKLDEVVYPDDVSRDTPIVMLAAGVGIAPFISMMRHAAHVGDRRDVHLLYANPTYADVAYGYEVDRFTHSLAPNLSTQKFLTREPRAGFAHGYFDREYIRSIIARSPRTFPIFFVSGSEGMVEATVKLLESMHVPDSRIRVKRFKGYKGEDDTIRE